MDGTDITLKMPASPEHQTIKQDGITGATVNRLAICSTGAGTTTKTASIGSGTFSLESGAQVLVKFNSANTANSPTLNINGTGAKQIYYKGAQITTGNEKNFLNGVCLFVYDGTRWHLVENYVHPAYTSHENGLYKVTVDETGHVSAVNTASKKDITDLGVPDSAAFYIDLNVDSATEDADTGALLIPVTIDKTALANAIANGIPVYFRGYPEDTAILACAVNQSNPLGVYAEYFEVGTEGYWNRNAAGVFRTQYTYNGDYDGNTVRVLSNPSS